MKVVFSRIALGELDSILDHIATISPGGAIRVEARVREVIDRIARYPQGGQQVAERPGVRRVPLVRYPHVIYYVTEADAVTILRIIHGARRQPWDESPDPL